MADVEFVYLGEFDPNKNGRDFDVVSFGECYWKGTLRYELLRNKDEGDILVYSSRNDMLGEEYAVRPGRLEEVIDTEVAKAVISKAVVSCFDHTTTLKAISDGNGGWIPLFTDT